MNFLAHLVLAPQTPQGLTGSIAPDMIRGPLPSELASGVREAALEHQRIDRYTDTHLAFYRTRDRLRTIVQPRLAGILADVLYDHVLACDWSAYRSDTHFDFVERAHQHLSSQLHIMPHDMRWPVELMIQQQWLMSYATADGIRARLDQMSQRLSHRVGRAMRLTPSEADLKAVYPQIADDFSVLWPDLIALVARRRRDTLPRQAC